ncbi:hypothetical protein J2Z66_000654 [Paenibacillus eucommiae]|uniref:Uncharacterized protein n=1 Tax=Paenibacillus eucommiae TaxID=1355755 RepID=A0ABS4INE0_9BACL|nr:hypothetical protein [Paenibacillus eucommiae]
MLLKMKNIVKASASPSCAGSSSTAPAPARKSPFTKRKTLAGCPFELGVRVIRAIIAKEREWLWVEERKRPPLKICSYLFIDSVQGNKSLTAAGAHSHSVPPRTNVTIRSSKDATDVFLFYIPKKSEEAELVNL